ncbi:hypothetical protein C8J57DRAFT_229723 [Mycena rebaudengoi]|nr:hypothetical protein C8J57DRAFT_229723 [Mycena rebaudengoi]
MIMIKWIMRRGEFGWHYLKFSTSHSQVSADSKTKLLFRRFVPIWAAAQPHSQLDSGLRNAIIIRYGMPSDADHECGLISGVMLCVPFSNHLLGRYKVLISSQGETPGPLLTCFGLCPTKALAGAFKYFTVRLGSGILLPRHTARRLGNCMTSGLGKKIGAFVLHTLNNETAMPCFRPVMD